MNRCGYYSKGKWVQAFWVCLVGTCATAGLSAEVSSVGVAAQGVQSNNGPESGLQPAAAASAPLSEAQKNELVAYGYALGNKGNCTGFQFSPQEREKFIKQGFSRALLKRGTPEAFSFFEGIDIPDEFTFFEKSCPEVYRCGGIRQEELKKGVKELTPFTDLGIIGYGAFLAFMNCPDELRFTEEEVNQIGIGLEAFLTESPDQVKQPMDADAFSQFVAQRLAKAKESAPKVESKSKPAEVPQSEPQASKPAAEDPKKSSVNPQSEPSSSSLKEGAPEASSAQSSPQSEKAPQAQQGESSPAPSQKAEVLPAASEASSVKAAVAPSLQSESKSNPSESKNMKLSFEEELQQKGYTQDESGLFYLISDPGEGVFPQSADAVRVHYTGKLVDGTVFDSSVNRGQSIVFPLNAVIKGFSLGLQKLKARQVPSGTRFDEKAPRKSGKISLWIPAHLGYGDNPPPGSKIPAGGWIMFECELIQVVTQ